MNEQLTKELESQTQNFKSLITDYCRLESCSERLDKKLSFVELDPPFFGFHESWHHYLPTA